MTKERVMRPEPEPVPEKWLKYDLLEDFGLVPPGYASRNIWRFKWTQRFELVEKLTKWVENETSDSFWVVKCVPLKLGYLLPNHRVYKTNDINGLFDFFSRANWAYTEVWVCKTIASQDRFSVGGRIIIDMRTPPQSHVIEQVWNCSPRLIESVNENFAFPYARAVRSGWAWRPAIIDTIIPAQSKMDLPRMRAELHRAMDLFYPLRHKLHDLEEFLAAHGCDVFSIEYKIQGDSMRIIDWDTHQDGVILREWKSKRDILP